MKKLIFGILALASISSYSQTIIFEEEVSNSTIVIINSGNQIRFGNTDLVVAPRSYPNGRVRIGDNVITSDMRSGKIKSMFMSENKIVVYDNYYGNRQWTAEKIAVTSGCSGYFCVEDKVITSDLRGGTVKGYFSNGDLVVYDAYYGNRRWNPSNISMTDGCSAEFCKNDAVITYDNRNGKVVGFFNNGDLVVYDTYYGNRRWSPSKVSITTGVCSNIYIQRVEYCGN